jgi:hypothetical protein
MLWTGEGWTQPDSRTEKHGWYEPARRKKYTPTSGAQNRREKVIELLNDLKGFGNWVRAALTSR